MVADHAHQIDEQPLGRRQGFGLPFDRQVADADMTAQLSALGFEADQFLFQLGDLGQLVGRAGGVRLGEPARAGLVHPVDDLLHGAVFRIDYPPVEVDRLQGVFQQGVQVELVAHVFEEVLLRPAREQGAGDLGHRSVRMGGDQWHLPAVVHQAADLPHLGAAAQSQPPFGQTHGGPLGFRRAVDRHLAVGELLSGPIVALGVLVPGDAGDTLGGQAQEQGRTPAFAVEDQGHRRFDPGGAPPVGRRPHNIPQLNLFILVSCLAF